MSQATTTRITDIGTVGIPVRDQERALMFYRDTLGFEVRMDASTAPTGGSSWRRMAAQPRLPSSRRRAISPPALTPGSG